MNDQYTEKERKLFQALIERNGMQHIMDTYRRLCKNLCFLCRGLSTPLQIPYYTLLSDLPDGTLDEEQEMNSRLQCLKFTFRNDLYAVVIDFESPTVQARTLLYPEISDAEITPFPGNCI